MKIAVLGATGGTGVQIVKQALAGKHEVIAIVRNPDNLKEIQNPRLKVVFSSYSNVTRQHYIEVNAIWHRL